MVATRSPDRLEPAGDVRVRFCRQPRTPCGLANVVHAIAANDLAVLGFMLDTGEESVALAPYFGAAAQLPARGDEQTVASFDLNDLVPADLSGFYHYSGSLTTPPCSEGVRWFVADAVATISRGQLESLMTPIPPSMNPQGNRRPVQSRNGRVVYFVE